MCEIIASSWFYCKEICYDARSHECKKKKAVNTYQSLSFHVNFGLSLVRVFVVNLIVFCTLFLLTLPLSNNCVVISGCVYCCSRVLTAQLSLPAFD
jgi:hypothetical protein